MEEIVSEDFWLFFAEELGIQDDEYVDIYKRGHSQ